MYSQKMNKPIFALENLIDVSKDSKDFLCKLEVCLDEGVLQGEGNVLDGSEVAFRGRDVFPPFAHVPVGVEKRINRLCLLEKDVQCIPEEEPPCLGWWWDLLQLCL